MKSFKNFLVELESTIAYHEDLNPKIWDHVGDTYVLDRKVYDHLIKIANKFIEALKVPVNSVKDVVLTGSNCNFNWTKFSDIDIHIELDSEIIKNCETCSIEIEDCIQAKKTLWNEQHDIFIYEIPVEMYATTRIQDVIGSAGAFSLSTDNWIQVPIRQKVDWSTTSINQKGDELALEINQLIDANADTESLRDMNDKLSRMRQAGLESGGEFSLENLVFKELRNNGYVQKLRHQIVKSLDVSLSLTEKVNKKIFEKGFEKTKEIGKFTLIAKHGIIPYSPTKPLNVSEQFRIEAKNGKLMVGWVNFKITENKLEAIDVVVNPEYRRQGIATEMYKFAKELGNSIVPSSMQRPMGKALWTKLDSELKEAFDSKVDYKITVSDSDHYKAKATINNRVLIVDIFKQSGNTMNDWDLMFSEELEYRKGEKIKTYSQTGSGGEFKVFSMIKDVITGFMEQYKPDHLEFTADKEHGETRARLYGRMIKKLNVPGYDLKIVDRQAPDTIFILSRKDLKESLDSKVDYKITHDTNKSFAVQANIENRTINIEITRNDSDTFPSRDNVWELVFDETVDKISKLTGNPVKVRNTDVTGSGGELKVFSLVKEVLIKFLDDFEPKELWFSAKVEGGSKMNRINLYDRILKRFKHKDYEYDTEKYHDKTYFVLKKKLITKLKGKGLQ